MYMEWLQVFDKNQNIVDKKVLRGSNIENDDYIMIVYVFIVNKDKKILLEKNTKYDKWVIPGGHVISDDPVLDLKRECSEELGIEINTDNLKIVDTLCNNHRFFKLYFLEYNIDLNAINLQKEEVSSVNLFSVEEIDNLISECELRDNNIIFIEKLKKYLLN